MGCRRTIAGLSTADISGVRLPTADASLYAFFGCVEKQIYSYLMCWVDIKAGLEKTVNNCIVGDRL